MTITRNSRIPLATSKSNEITPDGQAIRSRAYELYESRGKEPGHEVDDWLRAEEELTHRRTKTIAA